MGKSLRLAIVLAGARGLCSGILALLTLPFDTRVEAVTFTFSGFKDNSLSLVSNSNWIFNTTTRCFQINPAGYDLDSIGSGRILYPGAVQMIDPDSTTVKSFSTSFIYQLQIGSNQLGPGMAFIIVPDNTTLGAPQDFMGLITSETSGTAKNYESDNHTLGVELDTYMNPGFNDTNNNHIGINLASMNSTYSFKPDYSLASSNAILYQQIWIDYDDVNSRMDIYCANYKQGKPAKPQGSKSGLDLSLLKENMYIGFSSANKLGSFDVPHVCAWSFSNDGNPAAPPPYGPVAAPSLPPPTPIPNPPPVPTRSPAPGPQQAPPLPSPSPISPSPNGSPATPSASPPPFTLSPPPSSPVIAPSPGPGHGPHPVNLAAVAGGPSVGLVVVICLLLLCWYKVFKRPFRIFISHTGGPNGDGKNFPSFLHREMTSCRRWSRSKFRVKPFLDVENCPKGLSFARKIFKELERFDLGIVVVTPDFFERHWPMTELIKFVEVQKKDHKRRIRLLPLFFKLTPDELKQGLDEGKWKDFWVEPSEVNHPLQLQECKDAVKWLCQQTGIAYVPGMREIDYIDKILADVDKILCHERSFAADRRWAMNFFKRK